MEDGNCHLLKRKKSLPTSEDVSTNSLHKDSDISLKVNGGTERPSKCPKNPSFRQKSVESQNLPSIPSEVYSKSNFNNLKPEQDQPTKNCVPKIPKPIITKHLSYKRVLKRPNEDIKCSKVVHENGDHRGFKFTASNKFKEQMQSINKSVAQGGHQSKYMPPKRRKLSVPKQNDYAQYLGLQPAVKFKCGKCCCSSFESLGMLKEHQRFCSPKSGSHLLPTPSPSLPAPPNANFRITRKVYLCSACGTYYENWNLFLHIREVHNRHTCLFCFGMFSQAQKLASHLVVKHNIQEDYFTSKEDLSAKFSDSFYLLCCKCEKVFTERDIFVSHECMQVVKQCSVCKLKGGHVTDCPKSSSQKHKRVATPVEEVKKGKQTPVLESLPHSPLVEKVSDNIAQAKSTFLESPQNLPLESVSAQVSPSSNDTPTTSHDLNAVSNSEFNLNSDLSTFLPNKAIHNNNYKECKLPSDTTITLLTNVQANIESECSLQDKTNVLQNVESFDKIDIDTVPKENNDCLGRGAKSEQIVNSPPVNMEESSLIVSTTSSTENQPSIPKLSITMSQYKSDVLKAPTKPPPRNRRPPKRYQLKTSQLKLPSGLSNQIKDIVHKVPKLTVKIPKVLMEKESSSDYSSESEDSDKLTVDCDTGEVQEGDTLDNTNKDCSVSMETEEEPVENALSKESRKKADCWLDELVVAGEDVPVTELSLDHPLDRYALKDLLKVFLSVTIYNCIYCNHAHKIAVNAKQLSLHFVSQHRFSATVDSITAEELLPETIVLKIKSCLEEAQDIFLNLEGYDSEDKTNMAYYDSTLECFQCFYVTKVHKELYLHNRKLHQKTILLCVMCKSNFYSYSELLCHLCPGTYVLNNEIQFRCCLCQHDIIPSAFRLMVHLRKCHNACDVCLETCQNQSKLSNHIWKHKLHHLCYRCGIAYRNKPDITKHLFWKHGTESVLCKKCLQKRWPHVYHFCIPPTSFNCEECNLTFTKAVSLKVHKRLHSNDLPYPCVEPGCQEKFVSKKILKKHEIKHLEPPEHLEDPPKDRQILEQKSEVIDLCGNNAENLETVPENLEEKTAPKLKKSKKNKKNKDKDNLLIDVNLPALNLSESDSSEESESEITKKPTSQCEEGLTLQEDVGMPVETPEEPKIEPPVPGIWDNFKLYQAQVENIVDLPARNKPKHVCDSDHDYCVIPANEDDSTDKLNLTSPSKESKKKFNKSKKKSGRRSNGSSSSDSSSDSDSSCSCGSNCSCSSSSGSSSSSSSSSDSESSSTVRKKPTTTQKDSDASAVDIMATEESPLRLTLPEPLELPLAESDLETDETDTDEDFYDEHPQRLANKILAEKRNQLMLLATVASVNNGTYLETSRPPSPENVQNVNEVRKKGKTKKKKKIRKTNLKKQIQEPALPVAKITIHPEENRIIVPPNKITISLQTNTVIEKTPVDIPRPSTRPGSDSDNKRASKRRRVPNKFYGYSSDEENPHKPQLPPKLEWRKEDLPPKLERRKEDIPPKLEWKKEDIPPPKLEWKKEDLPPKLEWRKEDLPSPSGTQQPPIPEVPSLAEILARESKPIIMPKLVIKEPIYTSSDEDSDSSREGVLQINHPFAEMGNSQVAPNPPVNTFPRPPFGTFPFPRPAGVRQAREGESVYCYCRCPYDEVSEMIACDAEGCSIEWFHFECVGIMVPPKGKWYCPDCRQRLEDSEI